MAFKEYLAVLDSDLYEYKGTTKSILARIAHLIIGPPEEGPNGKLLTDPSPDEGMCVATQEYLACQLGVSESTVRTAVATYEEDGWLIIHRSRDKHGHDRNKYSLAPGALERIQARKRQRDEQGEYIRPKQLTMQRAHSSGQFAGRVTRVNEASTTRGARVNTAPPSNLHAGLQADCATASKQIARQPPGKLPAVVGLEAGIVSKSQSKTKGASDNTSSASLTDQDQNQTPSTPWDDEEQSAPVNPTPKPRGVAPNPTGTSRPGTPGRFVSPTGEAPIPPPPALTLEDCHILVNLHAHLSGNTDLVDSLQAFTEYRGPLSGAVIANAMRWAYKKSSYWAKHLEQTAGDFLRALKQIHPQYEKFYHNCAEGKHPHEIWSCDAVLAQEVPHGPEPADARTYLEGEVPMEPGDEVELPKSRAFELED